MNNLALEQLKKTGKYQGNIFKNKQKLTDSFYQEIGIQK